LLFHPFFGCLQQYVQTKTVFLTKSASVGGVSENLCFIDPHYRYFNDWGNLTHAGNNLFVQNQGNLDDFPCFSRSYIRFPGNVVPAGKTVKSVKLGLWHLTNNGSYNNFNMLAHVFKADGWVDGTQASWNNAPLSAENIAGTWISQKPPLPAGVPSCSTKECGQIRLWQWDVTKSFVDSMSQPNFDIGVYMTGNNMHMGVTFASETLWTNTNTNPPYNAPPGGVSHYYDPYLLIEYGDATGGTSTPTATPTTTATATPTATPTP
jgi:hypothetical protein